MLIRHRSERKTKISKGTISVTRRENNGVNQKSNVDAREQRNVGLGKQTTSNGNDKSGNIEKNADDEFEDVLDEVAELARTYIGRIYCIKPPYKIKAGKNGNLYKEFKKWKEELQNIQTRADANPHDAEFKRKEAKIMKGYSTAAQDEEIFLCQQAKIDWLRDGDRNSKFFHAILKSRNHKNGVAVIRNE
ncbi:hypothetical protein Tco_0921276 [Tanacetum coccineum]